MINVVREATRYSLDESKFSKGEKSHQLSALLFSGRVKILSKAICFIHLCHAFSMISYGLLFPLARSGDTSGDVFRKEKSNETERKLS